MSVLYFPAPRVSEEDTLIYYDGDLLVLADLGDDAHRVMGVALFSSEKGNPFLVVEITPEQERRLMANEVTLRKLCLECLPPNGLGAYRLTEYYADVWELMPITEIAEDDLPGDVTLRRMP